MVARGNYDDIPIRVDIEGNIENDSIDSETHVKGQGEFDNHINSVKLSSSLSSRGNKMAMVLKMGTGGDNQDHVSTPKSLKEIGKYQLHQAKNYNQF